LLLLLLLLLQGHCCGGWCWACRHHCCTALCTQLLDVRVFVHWVQCFCCVLRVAAGALLWWSVLRLLASLLHCTWRATVAARRVYLCAMGSTLLLTCTLLLQGHCCGGWCWACRHHCYTATLHTTARRACFCSLSSTCLLIDSRCCCCRATAVVAGAALQAPLLSCTWRANVAARRVNSCALGSTLLLTCPLLLQGHCCGCWSWACRGHCCAVPGKQPLCRQLDVRIIALGSTFLLIFTLLLLQGHCCGGWGWACRCHCRAVLGEQRLPCARA
jgi:hypothetical protein